MLYLLVRIECSNYVRNFQFRLPSAYTECKHFLVDTSSGLYTFVGPKQQKFKTLTELLKYYRYAAQITHALSGHLPFLCIKQA